METSSYLKEPENVCRLIIYVSITFCDEEPLLMLLKTQFRGFYVSDDLDEVENKCLQNKHFANC